jgi:hypothetical protein
LAAWASLANRRARNRAVLSASAARAVPSGITNFDGSFFAMASCSFQSGPSGPAGPSTVNAPIYLCANPLSANHGFFAAAAAVIVDGAAAGFCLGDFGFFASRLLRL